MRSRRLATKARMLIIQIKRKKGLERGNCLRDDTGEDETACSKRLFMISENRVFPTSIIAGKKSRLSFHGSSVSLSFYHRTSQEFLSKKAETIKDGSLREMDLVAYTHEPLCLLKAVHLGSLALLFALISKMAGDPF
jgi:hypothetical protein